MISRKSFAGKEGKDVRSDCFIELELKSGGVFDISLTSKVKALYGNSIINQIEELCSFFELPPCTVRITDSGALPFVISARFETAVKRLFPETEKEYLPEKFFHVGIKTEKNHIRRSRLYLPGNEPKYFINAGLHSPDGIILDLEDSVHPDEKDAAAILVRNALRCVNFYGAELMVRINQMPAGLNDLKYIVPNGVQVILVPKCENAEELNRIEMEITRLKNTHSILEDILLMPIIESAEGVLNAQKIAKASPNVCALAIGLEDYTADIGAIKTNTGNESLFARCTVINSAKAAGIQAIDSVFADIEDSDALRQSVIDARALGFEGKGCIHPAQISIIHDAFKPSDQEIQRAIQIVNAFEKASFDGKGVIALGNKMIDPPVVKRAQNLLRSLQ